MSKAFTRESDDDLPESPTTMGGIIAGTGGLTKSGSGRLTINGNNSYSGATSLNAGTVAIGSDTAFGTSAVKLGGAIVQTAAWNDASA